MFRLVITGAAVLVFAGAAMAAAPSPHRALARPAPAPRAGCLDSSRTISHIAYVPAALQPMPRCGHLLATDTIIAVRQWNRT